MAGQQPTEAGAALDVSALEHRLVPFIENRIASRHYGIAGSRAATPPSERDFLQLAGAWNRLTPKFRQLYKKAIEPPDSSEKFSTPGGHFEIYYFTSGINAVATDDAYGFDVSDWRVRTPAPNGIPDYIDETGFALDSAWSMEIDRFGFFAPPVSSAGATFGRYGVVVETQEDSFYGLTYLQPADKVHGYTSSISLRNDWSGEEWSALGYDRNPTNGQRVTCAHEFFHAIQYGMVWNVIGFVNLDDFPYGWTEGTATSMEELAFDSINDYLQYSSQYFANPGMSFFNRGESGIQIYSNSLLVLYLYRHVPPGNSIDFIRSFYRANYAKRIQFDSTLLAAASGYGTSWTSLLHGFHMASFFTGTDADTARFIADAPRFMMHPAPALENGKNIVRSVASNGALHLRVSPKVITSDTLSVTFTGSPPQSAGIDNSGWACSILLRKGTTKSVIPVAIDSAFHGSIALMSWQSCDDAVIVITNGDPASDRKILLSFGDTNCVSFGDIKCPDTVDTNPTMLLKPVVFPNPVSLSRHQGTVHVRGNDLTTVSIRALNGKLIRTLQDAGNGRTIGELQWNCTSGSGKRIVPGAYIMLASQHNTVTGTTITTRHKVLVMP